VVPPLKYILRIGRPKWQPLFDQKFRTGLYSEIFQKDKIPYLIKKIGMCQVINQASLYSEKFQKDKKLQDATKFFNMEKPQPKNWLKKF
jgi:hypothetical protein